MRRSNAPVFWLLFGAGGLLAALFGPMLVVVTGIAAPLGWPLRSELLSYARMLAFVQHWAGKAFVLALITLFAWHAAHRIFHSLHDLGVRRRILSMRLCYGSAAALTVIAAVHLMRIGFGA